MSGKRFRWLLVGAVLMAVLSIGGCAELLQGVLMQKEYDDGHKEKVYVDGGEGWASYDRNATKGDGTCLMLRKETTF